MKLNDSISSGSSLFLDTPFRILSKEELAFMQRNYKCLVDLINSTDSFVEQLSKESCITARQKETILYHKKKLDRNRELLAVLKRRSFVHFGAFKDVLKETKHNKLLQIFDNIEKCKCIHIKLRIIFYSVSITSQTQVEIKFYLLSTLCKS